MGAGGLLGPRKSGCRRATALREGKGACVVYRASGPRRAGGEAILGTARIHPFAGSYPLALTRPRAGFSMLAF